MTKQVGKMTKKFAQERVDEIIGVGHITILKSESIYDDATFKCNINNEEFTMKLGTILYSSNECPICKEKRKKEELIKKYQRIIDEKFNNKAKVLDVKTHLYVSGKSGKKISRVILDIVHSCGHREERNVSVINSATLNCQKCNSFSEKFKKKNKQIEKNIFPLYKVLEVYKYGSDVDKKLRNTRRMFKLECKKCGDIIDIHAPFLYKHGKCSCINKEKLKISLNLLDIFFEKGKTEKLNDLLDIEYIKELRHYRQINYTFKTNDFILPEIEYSRSSISKIKLPHKYMKIVFDTPVNYIDTRNNMEIYEINILNFDNLEIDNIFSVVFRTKRVDKIRTLRFYSYQTYTVLEDNLLKPYAHTIKEFICRIILMLTSSDNNYYLSDSSKSYEYNDEREESITNLVEYKDVTINNKTKNIIIKDKGRSKRKIKASFDVRGHWHTLRNGKKKFFEQYEKGKQYRNIKRIEKNYIIK